VSYPLRVLFVVDGSESMEVSDPPDLDTGLRGRQVAVQEVWERLLEESDGSAEVQLGLMRFSAQAEPLTGEDLDGDGVSDTIFTRKEGLLRAATQKLEVTDRTTNYLNALDAVYTALRDEATRATDEALGRSRFVVIFISDGLPSDGASGARGGLSSQVADKISDMRKLEELFGVGEVTFHTLFLSSEQGLALDQAAQELLGAMAEAGGGTYRSFPSGERLNFLHISLTRLQRLYALKRLTPVLTGWVQGAAQLPEVTEPLWDAGRFIDANQDGAPSCGEPLADLDGDGLADLFERRLGTHPQRADSDGDGVNDLVEWRARRSGLDPLDPYDARCVPLITQDEAEALGRPCDDPDGDGVCACLDEDLDGACDVPDSDSDGLNDCEELFLGSSPTSPDSDDDGLPDVIEARFSTSLQQSERGADLDWDGTDDLVEVMSGFDPRCDDAATRSRVGYARSVEEVGVEEGRPCYDFTLSQLPLYEPPTADLGAESDAESEDPLIKKTGHALIFAGEGAFDERREVSIWRAACVEMPPPSALPPLPERAPLDRPRAVVTLEDTDFKPLSELKGSGCLSPLTASSQAQPPR
jgi:hypothetical protein